MLKIKLGSAVPLRLRQQLKRFLINNETILIDLLDECPEEYALFTNFSNYFLHVITKSGKDMLVNMGNIIEVNAEGFDVENITTNLLELLSEEVGKSIN